MSRKSRPYRGPRPAPTAQPPEPCHRCGGTGVVIRYRRDGSVKSRTECPCRKAKA